MEILPIFMSSSGLQQHVVFLALGRGSGHLKTKMLRLLRRNGFSKKLKLLLCFVVVGVLLFWHHSRPPPALKDKDLKILGKVPTVADRPAIVLEQERLLFCPMFKNLHIPMLALLCRKAGESDATIEIDYRRLGVAAFSLNLISFCLPKLIKYDEDAHAGIWLEQPEALDEDGSVEGYHKVAIIRDPFERFLATWNFVCLDNLGCFVRQQFYHFKNISLIGHPFTVFDGDAAFYPQSWHCDLAKYADKYTHKLDFTKEESFFEELRETFVGIGWEEIMNSGWGLNGEQKFLEDHTGLPSPEDETVTERFQKLLKQSLNYGNLLFKSYYADFLYLNLDVPEYVKDACRKAVIKQPTSDEEDYDEETENEHFAVCRYVPR